jgi:RDD family
MSEVDDDGAPSQAAGPDPTVPAPGTRLIATGVDALVAAVLITLVDFVLIGVLLHPAKGQLLSQAQSLSVALLSVGLGALVFVLMEHGGGTAGQRLTRLRVVQMDRTLPGWGPLTLRYATIFVPLISTLGLLVVVVCLLVAVGQSQRRNVFDLLTRLRLVPVDQVVSPAG